MVLHGKAPPFARRRFDDPALVQVEAAALAGIRRIQFERRILAAAILGPVTLADAQALFFADGGDLPRARDSVGPGALHGYVGARNRADYVVLALNPVNVRAFAHALGGLDQHAIGARHQSGEVLVQFHDADGSGAIDGVDLPVIVEQDGEVVETLLDPVVLPETARIGGAIHLKAEAVDVGEDVIGSVVVAETRGPDAAAIDALAGFRAEVRAEVQAVEGIADDLPVPPI